MYLEEIRNLFLNYEKTKQYYKNRDGCYMRRFDFPLGYHGVWRHISYNKYLRAKKRLVRKVNKDMKVEK